MSRAPRASFEAIAAAAAAAGKAATPTRTPDVETLANDCWRVRRVRGASYHESREPDTSQGQKDCWCGPYSVRLVLEVARTRSGRGIQPPAASQPLSLRPQPEQTIPSPTHALKAEMAARCMRPFLMASFISGKPPPAYAIVNDAAAE